MDLSPQQDGLLLPGGVQHRVLLESDRHQLDQEIVA
jgi:hypothetical protein